MDFLSEENVAGQTLLRLVSRGNAIIAELLRLSDNIPSAYLRPELVPFDQRMYHNVLFDFKYLAGSEHFELKIESSPELIDLDEMSKENHLPILERFYLLFESVYKYIKDFLRFLEDLNEGVYIQLTFEHVLNNFDGKQLLSEALYLFGVMLLFVDNRIEGYTRERMLISYYRYKGSTAVPMFEEVCKVCKGTGFVPGQAKPANYPDEYFSRFKVPPAVVKMIIGRLRSDDIYDQISKFPTPEHRSVALANQASMLYVLLWFVPDLLHREQATMREIVDKHFPDNWVVAYYMGYTADVWVEWQDYKAARAALNNTIVPQSIKEMQAYHVQKLKETHERLNQYLTEGVMVEDFLLDNIPKILGCMRNANVTLRWLFLHLTAGNKKFRDIVSTGLDVDSLLFLLLRTSEFEYTVKNIFKRLMDSKEQRWNECQKEASEGMTELSEYFSGEKALTRVKKDEQLQAWFADIATQIRGLESHDSTLAGRKIQQLMTALEEVEQFHQIDTSLQVKTFLADTRQYLKQMIRVVNIKDDVMAVISVVSDLSYAWGIINDYIPIMHARIKRDPFIVLSLRSMFLKLVSILDLPLVRISQAQSNDLVSVSEYYSSCLVQFVRKTLEVIPVSMFSILNVVIGISTTRLKVLPSKVLRSEIRDYSQLEDRANLAKVTHSVSVLTEGILEMDKTLIGVIEVDPRKLLDDGIRKELVRLIAEALNHGMVFKQGTKMEFEQKLEALAVQLDGLRRSFEYIQDYIGVYGLKIWQEEYSRIMSYNVEQECNRFLKQQVYDWQSQYQNNIIPIPVFKPVDNQANTFLGRLVNELLMQTNPLRTAYLTQLNGWVDLTGKEVVGIRLFQLLQRAVGVFGLAGMDRLLCFMAVENLQKFVANYRKCMSEDMAKTLDDLTEKMGAPASLVEDVVKVLPQIMSRMDKLWGSFRDVVMRLGQIQLLRKQTANSLNYHGRLESTTLLSCLDVFNKAIINDVRAHYQSPDTNPYPKEDNPIMAELAAYLVTSGIGDPFMKIYITTDHVLDRLPFLLFLFVLSQVPKLNYDKFYGAMPAKNKEVLDGTPFAIGVVTLLKQFHISNTHRFLAYVGQYIRSDISCFALVKQGKKGDIRDNDLPVEAMNMLLFLENVCKYSHLPNNVAEGHLPSYVYDRFKH